MTILDDEKAFLKAQINLLGPAIKSYYSDPIATSLHALLSPPSYLSPATISSIQITATAGNHFPSTALLTAIKPLNVLLSAYQETQLQPPTWHSHLITSAISLSEAKAFPAFPGLLNQVEAFKSPLSIFAANQERVSAENFVLGRFISSQVESLAMKHTYLTSVSDTLKVNTNTFRLPEAIELNTFANSVVSGISIAPQAEALRYVNASLINPMSGIRAPWIDSQMPSLSLASFGTLAAVHDLVISSPFAIAAASQIRSCVGDWRSMANVSSVLNVDTAARYDIYRNIGVDEALVHFPRKSYFDVLVQAGFSIYQPDVSVPIGVKDAKASDLERVPPRPSPQREGLYKMGYAWEMSMRTFIAKKLFEHYGVDWDEKGIPQRILVKLRSRQTKARAEGRPNEPMLNYADVADYETIICLEINWKSIFVNHFIEMETFRASINAVIGTRNVIAHHRTLLNEDVFVFTLQVTRLLAATGR